MDHAVDMWPNVCVVRLDYVSSSSPLHDAYEIKVHFLIISPNLRYTAAYTDIRYTFTEIGTMTPEETNVG